MHNLVNDKLTDPDYPDENSINGWLNFLKGVDERGYQQMERYWQRLRSNT